MKNRVLLISLALLLGLSIGLVCCTAEVPDIPKYTLTICSTEGGDSNCVPPPGCTCGEGTEDSGGLSVPEECLCAEGTEVSIEATPDAGYHFVGWTGDVETIANVKAVTTTITMNGDYSISANFGPEPWDYEIPLDLHCTASNVSWIWRYGCQPWVWAVQNATGLDGGKFNFNITFNDTLYAVEDSLTALNTGVADLGLLSGDTFHLGSIGYLPLFFPDMASCAYATHNLLVTEVEDWDALGELDDVKILLATPLAPAQWWGNIQVTELADLAGLKVRAVEPEVPITEALGATAVVTSAYDLNAALEADVVHGCFFPYGGATFWLQLWQVVDYISQVNLYHTMFFIAMNRAVYESLHPDARALLDSYSTADWSVQLAQTHEAGQGGARGFLAGKGLFPTLLPSEELDNWRAACQPVFTDFVANMDYLDFDGQGILDRLKELIAEYEASTS